MTLISMIVTHMKLQLITCDTLMKNVLIGVKLTALKQNDCVIQK